MTKVPDGIEWRDVESSNVVRVAFDENEPGSAKGDLLVEYASGGVYRYSGVPREVFEEVLGASEDPDASVGRLINSDVKGVYEFERLAVDDEDD